MKLMVFSYIFLTIEFIPFQHEILEKKTIEFFPPPLFEYGEKTAPAMSRNRSSIQGTTEKEQSWKPNGCLVANYSDHKGPVTVIKISSDQSFFVSGSEDGKKVP